MKLNVLILMLFIGTASLSAQIMVTDTFDLGTTIFEDINGDGIAEKISYDSWTEILSIESNDNFNYTLLDSKDIGFVRNYNLADLNNDGYPEVVLTNPNYLTYIENNNGNLGDEIIILELAFGTTNIMNGYGLDIDNDEDGDLLVHFEDGTMYWIENIDGSFDGEDKKLLLDLEGLGGGSRATYCDYNQDGYYDIIFYNSYRGAYILINDGNTNFSSKRLSDTWNPTSYHVADVDLDGYPDIIQSYRSSNNSAAGSVEVHLNENGTNPKKLNSDNYFSPGAIDVEDIDGDQIPEIIIGDRESLTVLDIINGELIRSDVWGTSFHEFPGNYPISITTKDFNKDGKLQFLFRNYSPDHTLLLSSDYNKSSLEEFDCSNFTPNGNENLTSISNINIFPNPSSTYIEIESEFTPESIKIYDITGKIVKNKQKQNTIDIRDLSPGFYSLGVIIEGVQYKQKLVVE